MTECRINQSALRMRGNAAKRRSRASPLTLSLSHEGRGDQQSAGWPTDPAFSRNRKPPTLVDRKSTRLNSSHVAISYAVFCLKKKRKNHNSTTRHHTVPRTKTRPAL